MFNKFRSYGFDTRVMMCSVESEQSSEACVQAFNKLFSSFLSEFQDDDSFATVTPFGIHFRLPITAVSRAISMPARFIEWISRMFKELEISALVEITDFTIVPASLLDPETFKAKVKTALDAESEPQK